MNYSITQDVIIDPCRDITSPQTSLTHILSLPDKSCLIKGLMVSLVIKPYHHKEISNLE